MLSKQKFILEYNIRNLDASIPKTFSTIFRAHESR
jgi:hypothetical protein